MDVGDGEGEVDFGELTDSPLVVYAVEDVVSDFFFDRIRCWSVGRHGMLVVL